MEQDATGQPSTIRWGRERERLLRLTTREKRSTGEIARKALIQYELGLGHFKDTVRDAILDLFEVLLPDGRYDPEDDTRQEQAVQHLGTMLDSMSAAEGIAEAFTLLLAENMVQMSTLHVPHITLPPSGFEDNHDGSSTRGEHGIPS